MSDNSNDTFASHISVISRAIDEMLMVRGLRVGVYDLDCIPTPDGANGCIRGGAMTSGHKILLQQMSDRSVSRWWHLRQEDAGACGNTQPTHIIITQFPRIGITHLRMLRAVVGPDSLIVVVTRYPLTPQAQKTIVKQRPPVIESIAWTNALLNPQNHVYGSKHEKVTPQEMYADVGFHIPLANIPKMMHNDPVSVYLGFGCGDVIRIHRESDVYYRLVV